MPPRRGLQQSSPAPRPLELDGALVVVEYRNGHYRVESVWEKVVISKSHRSLVPSAAEVRAEDFVQGKKHKQKAHTYT